MSNYLRPLSVCHYYCPFIKMGDTSVYVWHLPGILSIQSHRFGYESHYLILLYLMDVDLSRSSNGFVRFLFDRSYENKPPQIIELEFDEVSYLERLINTMVDADVLRRVKKWYLPKPDFVVAHNTTYFDPEWRKKTPFSDQ